MPTCNTLLRAFVLMYRHLLPCGSDTTPATLSGRKLTLCQVLGHFADWQDGHAALVLMLACGHCLGEEPSDWSTHHELIDGILIAAKRATKLPGCLRMSNASSYAGGAEYVLTRKLHWVCSRISARHPMADRAQPFLQESSVHTSETCQVHVGIGMVLELGSFVLWSKAS